MTTFLGTLVIVLFCCGGLGIGLMLGGRPLEGGCGGKAPGSQKCETCPKRRQHTENEANKEGEAG